MHVLSHPTSGPFIESLPPNVKEFPNLNKTLYCWLITENHERNNYAASEPFAYLGFKDLV